MFIRVTPEVEDFVNARCFPHETAWRQVFYVDGAPAPAFNQVITGPCQTLAGDLSTNRCAISRETADAIRTYLSSAVHPWPHHVFADRRDGGFLISEPKPKEPAVAADIEHKTCAVKREEWFVPTGGYHDQHGACWTDLMLAITYATQRLKELKQFDGVGEPASDQIKIVPHDEHVVVRVEYTEQQK